MIQKNRSFIVYLDDNDERKEAFVEVIESNASFVKFATNRNVITIPFSRIIKLKEERKIITMAETTNRAIGSIKKVIEGWGGKYERRRGFCL